VSVQGSTVRLGASPLAGGPATISYRAMGTGDTVVVFLHGGWGYQIYPFDAQARALESRYRILIPDRSGHGGSTPVTALPLDFHRRAAQETSAFLDELGIEKAVWWGHSDGAVIAAIASIEMPERVAAVVLEALHLYRDKPGSRRFFEQMVSAPDTFGDGVKSALNSDHGAGWRRVLRLDGQAWLDLASTSERVHGDLYAGRLPSVVRPTLLVHGGRDPRTEPGEYAAICACLPDATTLFLPDAGHSPHSEPASADIVSRAAEAFLEKLAR
jgi:pimeloyl-ACP methyl ester carboxylesterase